MTRTKLIHVSGAALAWLGCMSATGEHPAGGAGGPPATRLVLRSGDVSLSFPAADADRNLFGVRLAGPGMVPVVADQPIRIFTCSVQECPADGTGSRSVAQVPIPGSRYTSVASADAGKAVIATASLISPAGSRFLVEDRYSAAAAMAPGVFQMRRRITVAASGRKDRGFTSQFRLGFENAASVPYRLFSPAVWYGRNADVPAAWFGGTKQKPSIYWRETRAGLPLVMLQDPASGSAVTIVHVGAPPSSDADERSKSWLVDGGIRYGAFGVDNLTGTVDRPTSIGFIFPANETVPDTSAAAAWLRRSHPVAEGYRQEYSLLLSLDSAGGGTAEDATSAAMEASWRLAFRALHPAGYRRVSTDTVYDSGIDLIGDWSRNRKNDAQGVPGVVELPKGPSEAELAGDNWTYVIGYVGEQIPLGFQLFWRGIVRNDPAMRLKGERTLDFWANNAARTVGDPNRPVPRVDTRLPFTWYHVADDKFENSTCTFPIFLRYLGDGMEAMVSGAVLARQHAMARPNWERFAGRFGDWLIDHQNPDGSWYRAYNPDGTRYTNAKCTSVATVGDVKQNTTHVIRFLAQLYAASGNRRYLDAALRAGRFSIANTYSGGRYIGGTTDTPNVLDREAGIIATRAALALFDVTRDRSWLKWARQAAIFSETWTYAYDFPIRNAPAFQRNGPVGMSMIAAGQSGADISASLLTYDLFRLFLFDPVRDDHFRQMARFLESVTKYSTQLPGIPEQRFGYGRDGLSGEANRWFELHGNNSGKGSAYQWLPWLTNAQLDPLQRMQDRFGVMSIDLAIKKSLPELQARNARSLPGPFPGWGHPIGDKSPISR